ncbi:hypothetical protein LVJ94_02455 [Pendulispora rubella]|uniref:Uncharacterized protein n=1 Tax=Pendulispora rubella TaxID=2741070 RepID=A0ABZ2L5R9_9BACT
MIDEPNEQGIYDYPEDTSRRLPIFDAQHGGPQFFVEGWHNYFTWAWQASATALPLSAMHCLPWGHYVITVFHKRCIFDRGRLVVEWPDLTAAEYRALTQAAPEETISLDGQDSTKEDFTWDWSVVEPESDPTRRRSPLQVRRGANRYADAKAKAEQLSRYEETLLMVTRKVAVTSMY